MTLLPGDALKQFHYEQRLAKLRKKKTKKRKTSAKRKRTQKMDRELQATKREMWDESFDAILGTPICHICGTSMHYFCDCEIDHIEPRGMGGGKRDDSRKNLRLTHIWCNREKGSKREETSNE